MGANDKYCTLCKKEKEGQPLFGGLIIYKECECERKLREEKEKKDTGFAREIALKLRNQSSHLSSLGCKASFKTAVIDKENESGIKGGKYLLERLINNTRDDKKNGLVLQGTRGSGKTYIACAVINDFNSQYPITAEQKERILKERDHGFSFKDFTPVKSPCKFITEMDLFSVYFNDFNYCKTNSPIDEFKYASGLLVIDDVGTLTYENSRIQSMYHSIIDYRYSEDLPIILTTNLNRKALSDYLGDRVFDRLNACCYFVNLTSDKSRRG